MLNPNVVILRMFPSIRTETVAHFLEPPIEGVVLQCYGAGNLPNNRIDILDILKKAVERGVNLVMGSNKGLKIYQITNNF
jgi:lysophospholipase